MFLTEHAEQPQWVKREIATFLMRDTRDKTEAILTLKFDDGRISDFSGLLDLRHADFTKDFSKGGQDVLRRFGESNIKSTAPLGSGYDCLQLIRHSALVRRL